jgi:hypothetical protein
LGGVARAAKHGGPATDGAAPADEWERSTRMPRACTCASANASSIVLTGPHGTPAALTLFLHPVVLGRGRLFFVGPQPRLRLVASDRIGEDVIRLTYVPA